MKHFQRSRARGTRRRRKQGPVTNPLLSYPTAGIFLFASILFVVAPSDGHASIGLVGRSAFAATSASGDERELLDPRSSISPIAVRLASLSEENSIESDENLTERIRDYDGSALFEERDLEEIDGVRGRILADAHRLLGAPYLWGGTSPGGFDCSGFVQHVFTEVGIPLRRTMREIHADAREIGLDEILPGDLVFFDRTDHVGIYIGGGRFIHASSGAQSVTITDLDAPHYGARFIGAGRVIPLAG